MNKYVVVTGGTSGVGLSIVKDLLKYKFKIIIIGRNAEKGKYIQHQLGENIIFVSGDLSNEEQVKNISFKIKSITNNIYALILSHGIFPNNAIENINNNFLSHYLLSKELGSVLHKNKILIVTGNPNAVISLPICENQNNTIERLSWELTHKTMLMIYLSNIFEKYEITVNSFYPGDVKSNLMPYTQSLPEKEVNVASTLILESEYNNKTGNFYNNDGSKVKLNSKYNFDNAVKIMEYYTSKK
ncbi:SDR family NAD(P)-dependent oxidoreductase [Apilactobacillus timberlakei]|uniref:SDR family NAD(P)-dependent oxidoreductase n=1 Tax=Apilactobacillus timberlakei TaxID=2008380 RepID=UPI001129CC43|nr:SDR family NAD(P)-dependent oxidoreductase [Apilactobacillus timberlakei]TPR19649.1 SDR family NAD(P)-dependent oxidoreductase [Apilactobacillus timberlakei]TPR20626.1 SDR family NAD(P)-dependent oxidoreductase [Apilactobacillus timberlakei]TPR22669.1 SDR family NAD(P)-dependent oxidoreductase [Apilactobacillus timberlakei]TPR23183.1 SDR family NAD(P)-dependent oxidoreductase [Apilactobacillus timberlakei]